MKIKLNRPSTNGYKRNQGTKRPDLPNGENGDRERAISVYINPIYFELFL